MKTLLKSLAVGSLLLATLSGAYAREINDGKKTIFGCTWSVAVVYVDGAPTNSCSAYKHCGPGAPREVLYNGTTNNGGSSCTFNSISINHGQIDGALVESLEKDVEFSPGTL